MRAGVGRGALEFALVQENSEQSISSLSLKLGIEPKEVKINKLWSLRLSAPGVLSI